MEGHIFIQGEITENYNLYVQEKLDALKDASKIILHVQSPGGSVYGGYKTYHTLRSSGKPIEAIIEGECQSIATFIVLAADRIIARDPSRYMIHNPSAGMQGNAKDLENGASELRKIEQEMAEAYSQKTGRPIGEIKLMMDKETSMTASEAMGYGFIDEVKDKLKAVAFGKTMEKTLLQEIEAFGKKIVEAVKGVSPKANMQELVGKPIQIDGATAPDGTYVVLAGVITEVMEGAPAPMETPEEEARKQRMAALESELAALKASATELETAKAEAETKVTETVTMLGTLQSEFAELKKKTIGSNEPPAQAPVAKKEIAAEKKEEQYQDLKNEIFAKAGLDFILNKQSKN